MDMSRAWSSAFSKSAFSKLTKISLALALLLFLQRTNAKAQQMPGALVDAPFQAERIALEIGKDGIPHLNAFFSIKLARDRDGRIRQDQLNTRMGHDWRTVSFLISPQDNAQDALFDAIVTIYDVPALQSFTFNTVNKAYTVEPLEPGAAYRRLSPSEFDYCAQFDPERLTASSPKGTQVQDLGEKTIEGFETHGVRVADKKWITDTWCSRELAAVLAEKRILVGTPCIFTFELKNIKRGDPAPELFQVPVGYRLIMPYPQIVVEPQP